jgi:hypothetical protein
MYGTAAKHARMIVVLMHHHHMYMSTPFELTQIPALHQKLLHHHCSPRGLADAEQPADASCEATWLRDKDGT